MKTCLVDVREEGFDFVGYHFIGMDRHVSKKSLQKLKTTIRKKTRRNNGHSMKATIANVNVTLRGWFAYFQHSHRWTFEPLDRSPNIDLPVVSGYMLVSTGLFSLKLN